MDGHLESEVKIQTSSPPRPFLPTLQERFAGIDKVVWAMAALYLGLSLLAPDKVPESLKFVAGALVQISPFLLFSIAVAAYAQATGSENLIQRIFSGKPVATITAAALFGSLSPFCSCGVIPIVAGLLGPGNGVLDFVAVDGSRDVYPQRRRTGPTIYRRQNPGCFRNWPDRRIRHLGRRSDRLVS